MVRCQAPRRATERPDQAQLRSQFGGRRTAGIRKVLDHCLERCCRRQGVAGAVGGEHAVGVVVEANGDCPHGAVGL